MEQCRMQIGRKEAQAAVEKLSKATGFPDLVAQLEQEPSSEAGNPATPTIDIDLLTTNSEWTAEERQAYVRAILAELPPADQEYACSDLKTFHSYSIGHELEVNPLLADNSRDGGEKWGVCMAVDAKIGLIEWADIEAVIGKRKRARGAEIDAMRFE